LAKATVSNIDAISEVEGVNTIGRRRLRSHLTIFVPGQFSAAIYQDAFKRAEAAIPESGIALGSVTMT
jgi:hypothetical protein